MKAGEHMNCESYASEVYYVQDFKGLTIPDEAVSLYLKQASRHIDSLTYNRIVGKGFSNLTQFQQELIREVCCEQAEFEYENKDIFGMILQGYSINGVSMNFGNSWNVKIMKGIPIKRDTYEKLSQTGLCCRLAR